MFLRSRIMDLERKRRLIVTTAPHTGHRANRLLAALEPEDFTSLEPHLEVVDLPKGTVLYEPGQTICSTYFPHDAVVSLVEVMEDGRSAEVAIFGREGLCGLVSAVVTRDAFGRYVVHVPGRASLSSGCRRRSRHTRTSAG